MKAKVITYTVDVYYDEDMPNDKIYSTGDWWLDKWQENDDVVEMSVEQSEIETVEIDDD